MNALAVLLVKPAVSMCDSASGVARIRAGRGYIVLPGPRCSFENGRSLRSKSGRRLSLPRS